MGLERNISATQIIWAIGLLLGLALAVVMGSAIGNHDIQKVIMVLGAFFGIATFLKLGRHYWLLIPLSLGAKFPAVPLVGRSLEFPELAIAACSLFFLLRVATRKEKLQVFRTINLPILVFMAWVSMVFVLNPIGVAMLGSSVGGGRFYVKIALAFAAFLILSNRTYSEKDIRWVIGLLVFGAVFGMVYGIAEYAVIGPAIDPTTGMVGDEIYTWHQVLSLPAITVAFLIFSRWSPKEVVSLQRPLVALVYLGCLALALVSGKRMGFAAVLIAPLVSALVFRQIIYIPIALAVLFMTVATLVVGQGQWFTLPLLAQRTLSWLPGDWGSEFEQLRGGSDDFRAELRSVALENIKRDPIIGRGFSVDINETITAIGMGRYRGDVEVQAAGFALGRSWHNRWLGYAADFGIPLTIIQAIMFITILVLSFRNFRLLGNSSLLGVFSLYVFIFTCRDVIASHTSGHSAIDAFERWWMYGIIVAIYLQCTARTASGIHSPTNITGRPRTVAPPPAPAYSSAKLPC